MNEEEKRRRSRGESFWNAPIVRKECNPNIKYPRWNPYEDEDFELDFD